jgi:RHS repeat-associated protein
VSGAASATFVYDGDGNRVKATVSGTTTTYIGSYFEWVSSTSNMKKYYYAGSTRVAMRTGSSTINYLLGDHLGSTAITTNSSGVKSAEMRYYPWGTTRYTSGTTPTTFKFTGQRLETGIGLYFYNARWYDSSAGRFIQADSIVPSQNQGTDDSKYIQLLLIVDYHEPNLLSQLGGMYREELLEGAGTGGEHSGEKGHSTPKPTDTDPLEEDKRDETYYTNTANQALKNFNELRDIGKAQTATDQQDDKAQRSKGLIQVDMMPSRMNSMDLDRFAYTSNCPTKYTDPSGHCDVLSAGIGTGLIVTGVLVISGGIKGVLLGLAVTPAAPHPAIELAGISALIATGGGLIAYGGVRVLIHNECIPDFLD